MRTFSLVLACLLILLSSPISITAQRPGITGESIFPPPSNLPAIERHYRLDSAARARLTEIGFVVLPQQDVERLSAAYMGLFSDQEVGVFITTDVALHLFHNVLDELLGALERETLYRDLDWLARQIYSSSIQRHIATPDSQPLLKAAERHNAIIFAVAARLLDAGFVLDDLVEPEAGAYLAKVLAHTATEFYPGDDYTQYEPRGHYAGDGALERYFRAFKWLSRRIYRIEDRYYPADADTELVAAAALAEMVAGDGEINARWQKVYDITTLLAGPADSITPPQMHQALLNALGPGFALGLLEQEGNRAALRAELQKDDYPTSEIIPVPLQFPDQIPSKYVQFMGERYLPDGQAMQETCFPHVPGRFLPSGLDAAATVLSASRAEHWLSGEMDRYPELPGQIEELRAKFDAYEQGDWTKSVYNGWLHALRPVLEVMPTGAPGFMQGEEWLDKELNTAMASWTQLRHDFILYGKPTYIPSPWTWGPGLVEPVPETFGRLADLCLRILDGVGAYTPLPSRHTFSLRSLESELRTWESYARKVADGGWLTQAEEDAIHRVGIWLLGLFEERRGVQEKSPQLVADVAGDSNSGRVLHEGTGPFNPLIVTYTRPGEDAPLAAIGFAFSHFEFVQQGWDRLTDAEWAERLRSDPPPRPRWALGFLPASWRACYQLPLLAN